MRYTIIPRGLTLNQVEAECRRFGGRNIKVAGMSEMVFCELEPAGLEKLKAIPGLIVKEVKKTESTQVRAPEITPPAPITEQIIPVYGSFQAVYASLFYEFRESFTPALAGRKLVCAVLDSGIRKSHVALKDKVTYEANFSNSPTLDDVFDHGTGVAYLVCGGDHAPGVESGLAPGARVMNIKVLDDDGTGTTEALIMGINEVHDLFCQAVYGELPYGDPMYPNVVNMSLGTGDDGDPDNPLRLAVEKLYEASPGKFPIFCSAGNLGPTPGSITLPAAARHAWAVGAVTFSPFDIWQYSSRGPVTLTNGETLVKPEMVCYGVNILVASAKDDTAYSLKSGTSFASPMAAGLLCLMREAAEAYGVFETLLAMPYEELEYVVNAMSWKPKEPVMTKDNDWGYGMPLGTLMQQQFQPTGVVDMQAVLSTISPLLGIGLMGTMMGGIAKGLAV